MNNGLKNKTGERILSKSATPLSCKPYQKSFRILVFMGLIVTTCRVGHWAPDTMTLTGNYLIVRREETS